MDRDLKFYIVDAFTSEPFKGNPAGVCILQCPIEDDIMLKIARETGMAETAFVIQQKEGSSGRNKYLIRWFSPEFEMPICGHATLGTSKVLFDETGVEGNSITFSSKSGELTVRKTEKGISMDFPMDEFHECNLPDGLLNALGLSKYKKAFLGVNTGKLVLELVDKNDVLELTPDFDLIKKLNKGSGIKGIGVTAAGDGEYDFISRYFNPWAGVNEDQVTGSVHTVLAAYWSKVLGKTRLKAYQASARGGEINIEVVNGGRVIFEGDAVIVFKGNITTE